MRIFDAVKIRQNRGVVQKYALNFR